MMLRLIACSLLLILAGGRLGVGRSQEPGKPVKLRQVLALQHDTEAIDHVAFSPDGKRIVACCSEWQHLAKANLFINGHAKVWDAATGKHLLTIRPELECVSYATFSPDGKRLLAGHIGAEPGSEEHLHAIKIWDAATGKLQFTTRRVVGRVRCLAFTPDGQRFVSGHWGKQDAPAELIIWDAKSGKELLSLEGHKYWVSGLAVTPDCKRIVSGSADGTARVWDAKTGKELLVFKGHDSRVVGLTLSPDGKRVVTTQDWDIPLKKKAKVLIWDIATGKTLIEIKGLETMVRSLAFSPDGRTIMGGSQWKWEDKTPPRLVVWDADTGLELAKIDVEFPLTCMVFHWDGRRIVAGDVRKNVRVWEMER